MVDKSRRKLILACSAGTMLLHAAVPAAGQQPFAAFERVLLVGGKGQPIGYNDLQAQREYLFFYPYVSTPCFLLNLGKPTAQSVALSTQDGDPYVWMGGVGPQRSIVAFSAICSHKLSHPATTVSFIGYRSDPVGFLTDDNRIQRRAAVIQCCSEHSIYDPAQGAKVLSGPAPQPLAAVTLKEEQGRLYAVGIYGGNMFALFFERFGFRLALEYGEAQVRKQVAGTAVVVATEQYTHRRIQC